MARRSHVVEVGADLWIKVGGQALAGARRIALLEAIAQLGSITHAAKAVGLSYKGAWDAVEQMSNLAGSPLLERVAGGKGGGHTILTARGAQLVRNFALVQREHERFLARLNSASDGLTLDYRLIESIAMKTSARNQFAGTVRAIRAGAVNDEIELEIIGGVRLHATLTSDSRAELGLAIGTTAYALIPAASIVLVTDVAGAKFSARNQLAGTVARITHGAVNTEVALALAGGGSISAIVTNEGARSLELAEGGTATAIFKAPSVIIAVAA